MEAQTSKQQQESFAPVKRFMWALGLPRCLARGSIGARGPGLPRLTNTKLTCWPAVETLARETQVSRAWCTVCLAIIGGRWSDSNRAIQRQIQQLVPADDCAPQPRKACAGQPGKDCPVQPGKDCPPTRQGLPPSTRQGLPPNRVSILRTG